MVQLLLIEDKATDCSELLASVGSFLKQTIKYFDFSDVPIVHNFNTGVFSEEINEKEIEKQIWEGLDKLFKEHPSDSWLILLDYELCRNAPNEPDYKRINKAVRWGVINAIKSHANVYLMLYTSKAPEALPTFFDDLYVQLTDHSKQMKIHLFHRVLNISFLDPPEDFTYIAKRVIQKELTAIEKGEISDVHWASAEKPFRN